MIQWKSYGGVVSALKHYKDETLPDTYMSGFCQFGVFQLCKCCHVTPHGQKQ